MNEKIKLYIPLGVQAKTELFPGFGKREMLHASVGGAITAVVTVLVWLISQTVPTTVVTALIGIAASIMVSVRDHSNLSVIDQVRNMVIFAQSQKYYRYRGSDGWARWR